jgi:hypothetical protein
MHCANQFRKTGLRLSPASAQWRGTLAELREGKTAGRVSAASFVSGMKGVVSRTVRASVSRSSANFVCLQPVRLTLRVNTEEVVLPVN